MAYYELKYHNNTFYFTNYNEINEKLTLLQFIRLVFKTVLWYFKGNFPLSQNSFTETHEPTETMHKCFFFA